MTGLNILRFDSLPSTQDRAVELARNSVGREWAAVTAGEQTKGRGTGGNDWYSPRGQNLYFSLIAWPPEGLADPAVLNHAAALAVAGVLSGYGVDCKIKWPNDLLAGGKKICGILSTSGTNKLGKSFVVCGVGLNVDTETFPPALSGLATSMKLVTGRGADKEELLEKLITELQRRFGLLFSNGFISQLPEYLSLMAQLGDAYSAGAGKAGGTIAGISEKGWLLVKYSGGVEAVIPHG